MFKNTLLVCLSLLCILTGCKQTEVAPDMEALGLSFYPLAIGDYRVYNVTDIKFKFNKGDTTRFQMRERVDTTFIDQTNSVNYKIIRSVRPNENSPWVDDSVMVVSKSNSMVLLTSNNIRYVKLVFPVKEGAVWVGDAYNNHVVRERESKFYDRKELYTYANLGEDFKVSGKAFSNTVTVIQGSPSKNKDFLDNRMEVYAKEVGRVYRLFNKIVYSPCTSTGCPDGEEFKLQGHERHEVLISHGRR